MKDTLQLLQDYAGTGENTWLQDKLDLLKLEIDLEIQQSNIEGYRECIKDYDKKLKL